ncbi:MAG: hypothetical protein ACJ706_07080 [Nitrososphaeraceae archaeon]
MLLSVSAIEKLLITTRPLSKARVPIKTKTKSEKDSVFDTKNASSFLGP